MIGACLFFAALALESTYSSVSVEYSAPEAAHGVKLEYREQGKPDGWIRYVPKGGKPLVNSSWRTTLDFSGSAYVLFEGFTVEGFAWAQDPTDLEGDRRHDEN